MASCSNLNPTTTETEQTTNTHRTEQATDLFCDNENVMDKQQSTSTKVEHADTIENLFENSETEKGANDIERDSAETAPSTADENETKTSGRKKSGMLYGILPPPAEKFVWNNHLVANIKHELHNDWLIFVIHGFIGQSSILYKS